MNVNKLTCFLCNFPFDESIHIPRILPNCNHSICSLCLTNSLQPQKDSFLCPKDNITYSNIRSIDYFKINTILLEKIYQSKKNKLSYIKYHSQKNLTTEKEKDQKEKTHHSNKSKNDTLTINETTNNNTILISNSNSTPCYNKKIIKFENKFNYLNNSQVCKIHSLILNNICIDDKVKICSQCAQDSEHSLHKILNENEFVAYVDELVKVFQDMENNQKKLKFMNNNNLIEEIENKFNDEKNNAKKICKEIIDNINNQFKKLEKYLNFRKKEILSKVQLYNELYNLEESSKNWIDIVSNKIIQANMGTINDINIEFLSLLDEDVNKNIFNLINSGKQINDKYISFNKKKEIIEKINQNKNNLVIIEPNLNLINLISGNNLIGDDILKQNKMNNSKYNESFINCSKIINIPLFDTDANNTNKNNTISTSFELPLFKIKEDSDLIDSLNLMPISSVFLKCNNIFMTYENDDDNQIIEENEMCNTISNISNLFTNKNNIQPNQVYSKKKLISSSSKIMSKTYHNFFNSNDKKNLTLTWQKNNNNDFLTKANKPLSPNFKKLLFPKLLKVKTCDVAFIPTVNRRNSQPSLLSLVDNNIKTSLGNLALSPKVQSLQNILTDNKRVSIDKTETKKKCRKILKPIKLNINDEINFPKVKKSKYKRCASCSSSLSNNEIKDIKIYLKTNDEKNPPKRNNINEMSNFIEKKDKKGHKSRYTNKSEIITDTKNHINTEICNDNSNISLNDSNIMEKYICNQMKKNIPVFNRINLRGSGIQILCNFIRNNFNKKYKEIKLIECNLNDTDFCLLINCLIHNEIEIMSLNVSHNQISDNSSKYIFEIIKKRNCLKSIFLYNNNFSKGFKGKIKTYANGNFLGNIKLYI